MARDAARLVEVVAQGEHVCAALKALLARRVEETGAYRDGGYRTAGHWLSAKTGSDGRCRRRCTGDGAVVG